MELSDLVETEEVWYCLKKSSPQIFKTLSSKCVTAADRLKIVYKEEVIRITDKGNLKQYLRLLRKAQEYEFHASVNVMNVVREKINLDAYKLFMIDKLVFTEADIRILKKYTNNRQHYIQLAVYALQHSYSLAFSLTRSFNAFVQV